MESLKRNNHTVTKFYLSGFANESKQIRRTSLAEPEAAGNVSISNATMLRDFYLVQNEDGTLSDRVENIFMKIESEAARGFQTLLRGQEWPISPLTRGRIATWIALQHLRGTGPRSMVGEVSDIFVKMQIAVGGREGIRDLLAEVQETRPTETEVDEAWAKYSNTDSFRVQASPEEHIKLIGELLQGVTRVMFARLWMMVDFENDVLLTCDHPVVLVPSADEANPMGVRMDLAGGIFIPLNRRVGLLLDEILPEGVEGMLGKVDARFYGTGDLAEAFNLLVIGNAREAIFAHPDDAHLTEGLLPPPRRQEVVPPDYEQWRKNGEQLRGRP